MPGLVIVPEFDGNLTRTISETASLGRTPSATRSSLSNVSTMRLSGAIDSGGELQDAESAPGDDSEELTEDEEFDLSELRSRMLTSQTAAQLLLVGLPYLCRHVCHMLLNWRRLFQFCRTLMLI